MRSKLCALILIVTTFMLIGCGPSALAVQGEISYYEAQVAIAKTRSAETTPLVRIKLADPTLPANIEMIEVFAPPVPQNGPLLPQFQHKDFTPAWIPPAIQAIAPFGILWGGSLLVKEVGKIATGNNYNYNNTISGQSTGNMRVQGNTAATSSGGGSATATGMNDQTSVPTIVKPEVVFAPEPIVVNPAVVNPVIVQ